jgi:hypothetical protein
VRSLPTELLNNTYLGIERIDRRTIEASAPEITRLGSRRVSLLAAVDAPQGMRASELLRRRRRVGLGLTLAARHVRAVLVVAMRLPADGAPSVSPASDSRVTPTPAVLAEGDTGLRCGSTDEALAAEDNDALVDQALRAGSLLGIPNVEVGRGGGAAV